MDVLAYAFVFGGVVYVFKSLITYKNNDFVADEGLESYNKNNFGIKTCCYNNKEWRLNGLLHREDGPAVIKTNGIKLWYLNGKRHREDGPAIEYPDGSGQWHYNDKLHREDGPAVIEADGTKKWFVNGKCHRTDGPAIERASGDKEWWINGVNYCW